MDDLLEVGDQRPHAVEAGLLLDRLARIRDQLLGPRLLVDRQPVAELVDELLDPVGERVELVARVDLLAPRRSSSACGSASRTIRSTSL